jgi:maltose O-acetyltransferase
MTERELMLRGEPYLASDPDLVARRHRARSLTRQYDQTTENEREHRLDLLRNLLGGVGFPVEIEPPFHCDYGDLITIGDGFFANFGCVILDCHHVTIGRNVQFGPRVQVLAAFHPTDPLARRAGRELSAPVVIGDDVWIGAGAIVCPGVTIGDGSTIGAGGVVTRDIPPLVVAAGVPCRVLRHLDGPTNLQGLLP